MPADWRTMPMRARIPSVALGRIEAEDRDRARGALAVALEDLDGRGLARAVRAQEREDLALVDGQVDALDGLQRRRTTCAAVRRRSRSRPERTASTGARPFIENATDQISRRV